MITWLIIRRLISESLPAIVERKALIPDSVAVAEAELQQRSKYKSKIEQCLKGSGICLQNQSPSEWVDTKL